MRRHLETFQTERGQPVKQPVICQDCGEELEPGQRRTRCRNCKMLLCGWCYNHCHMLALNSGDDGCALRAERLANAARHARHVCTYPCEPCCEKDSEYSMELHATQPKKDWPTVKAEAKLTTRRKR